MGKLYFNQQPLAGRLLPHRRPIDAGLPNNRTADMIISNLLQNVQKSTFGAIFPNFNAYNSQLVDHLKICDRRLVAAGRKPIVTES